MPNEFWAAIIGALVGSIVGGFITYKIQQKTLTASTEQIEKEARERQHALGYALLFKMVRIHSGLASMRLHLEEYLGKLGQGEYVDWEPWQIVQPIANPLETVHFSTNEMAMLLSLKDNDLFNDLASLDIVHNSTIELFKTHASHRATLLEMLPAKMDGLVGKVELTQEQAMYVRPKMVEMNDLLINMKDRCIQDSDQAWDVLNRLKTTLNDKLGLGVSVSS